MTRPIPEGNTLRHLQSIVTDLRNGVDVWPADPVERAADKVLRKARARPVARDWPPLAWFLFGAAAMALCVALAAFAVDAVQTGAATAVQAREYAGW